MTIEDNTTLVNNLCDQFAEDAKIDDTTVLFELLAYMAANPDNLKHLVGCLPEAHPIFVKYYHTFCNLK